MGWGLQGVPLKPCHQSHSVAGLQQALGKVLVRASEWLPDKVSMELSVCVCVLKLRGKTSEERRLGISWQSSVPQQQQQQQQQQQRSQRPRGGELEGASQGQCSQS